jgi:hypothetical protein
VLNKELEFLPHLCSVRVLVEVVYSVFLVIKVYDLGSVGKPGKYKRR